ncbi:hypothetical protein [Deinococcus sp.]|uniref:hypothetical protein n=1 Tax=Deinococcus sp. TaxID=47478 RepID=UPI003C7C5EEF
MTAEGPSGKRIQRPPSREERFARLRWLDLSLGLLLGAGMLALVGLTHLSARRVVSGGMALLVPLYLWMAWRQYAVLDEYAQPQLLKAYSVHGFVTVSGLLLCSAWALWHAASVSVFALSVVFLLGWASSWLVWYGLRRGA